MKKILYTLITALLLISCHDDEMINNIPNPVEEGGKVTVTVGLDIPELQSAGSRALEEFNYANAANLPLQLVVFDENGLFTELGQNVAWQRTNNETVYFKVDLTVTNAKRYIHFILNSPATNYDWGTEDNLIGSLYVSGSTDAYWQRVEFPNGIEATAVPDGNGGLTYNPTDDLKKRMSEVPMLRNFAKVSVTIGSEAYKNLTDVSYYVVNVWNAGTVAPYYSGDFADFVNFNTGTDAPTRYMQLTQTGYEGIEPAAAELIQKGPTATDNATSWTVSNWLNATQNNVAGTSFYMYERRNTFVSTNVPSTFLLVKGKYKGSSNYSYYKLDLIYTVDETTQQKQYYNLLRNFHYAVNINSVVGAGYASAYDAATHAASNNLSGSIDLRDLTNISDSQDRLFVEYTDMTIVSSGDFNNVARTIKYKYIQASSGDRKTNANLALRELTEDNTQKRIDDIYYKNSSGTDVYIYQNGQRVTGYNNNNGIAIDSEGWSTLYVVFDGERSNTVLTNTLGFYIGNLSREVDYHLRSIMPMIVECRPSKVPTGVKQKVSANILIPAGITSASDPYQLFPLEFWVEAEQLTISPDVVSNKAAITQSPYEMPVASGKSIIPSKAANNKQTFRYKRTITNEEYQSLPDKEVTVNGVTEKYKIIPCHFLTNTITSASKVYAQNEYFNLIQEGEFFNATQDIKDATLTSGIYGIGQTARLTFTAVTAGTYTITSGNLNESRSVSKEVTLANNGTTTITLYTATWDKTSMATIIAPDGTEYDVMAEARKILPMKATTTLNGASFTAANSPTFQVYTDQTSALAWADNKVTDVTNSDLTSTNGTSKEIAGLKENSELWFAFQSGGYVYVASTTAGALAAMNAVLAFTDENRVEIPLEMSAEFGNGTQYYGIGKTFEMTFTTNKPGIYTLTSSTLTFVSKSNGITVNNNNQFEIEAAGEYKFTCTTTTWSDVASVTITRYGEEDKPLPVTGNERLWFKFGNMTGGSNKPDNDQNITVYGTDGTVYGTVKWSALDNGTAELKIESIKNISDPINGNLCYFQYTKTEWVNNGTNYRPNWQQITYTYKTNDQQIPQAGGSTTLNFQKQN